MNWWSETALLWLPRDGRPYPEDFATRAAPGSSDFYYLTLDAFDAIIRRRTEDREFEPWAFVLEESRILSPTEIDNLMGDWRSEIRAARDTTRVRAEQKPLVAGFAMRVAVYRPVPVGQPLQDAVTVGIERTSDGALRAAVWWEANGDVDADEAEYDNVLEALAAAEGVRVAHGFHEVVVMLAEPDLWNSE